MKETISLIERHRENHSPERSQAVHYIQSACLSSPIILPDAVACPISKGLLQLQTISRRGEIFFDKCQGFIPSLPPLLFRPSIFAYKLCLCLSSVFRMESSLSAFVLRLLWEQRHVSRREEPLEPCSLQRASKRLDMVSVRLDRLLCECAMDGNSIGQ